MERTHVFLRRHTERICTPRRKYSCEEGYCLRSARHMYQRGVSPPIENKSTCQLLQYLERQEANDAYHARQTRRENQQLKSEIRSRDITARFLEERLEYRRERNIKLDYKLQEKDDQIYNLKDQLHQTKTIFRENEDAMSETIRQQNLKLQYKEWKIENLQEKLNSKSSVISKLNVDYGNKRLHANDNRFFAEKEQMRLILQKRSDKETELNKHIAFQEAEIVYRKKKVRELTNTVKKKDVEFSKQSKKLQQTSAKLQETETKMDKAMSSLKEKNQQLQAKVESCNEKVKRLEEILDSKRNAINDENERQANRVLKQKDEEIIDLRHQLKQTMMTLERKESEMNKIIASLKKKTQDLENNVEHRDMTNQHLQSEVERYNEKVNNLEEMLHSKRTATDGDKRQSHTVMRQKDDQISDLRHQLKQTMMTLDRKESEMNEIIASLKQKTQDLENEVEHRNMMNQKLQAEVERCNEKVRNLEEIVDSKRIAAKDGDKRQPNSVMKQKDDEISDLRHQLKQTLMTLDRKESEMNEIIASLKKKTQDLVNEIEHRDMTIKDLDYKTKETSDRNVFLEKKVKENDCQLYKERDQRQHAFGKMQEKESEMEGIIASLKTKVKLLEDDIEHRDLKINHLEEVLNSKTVGTPAKNEANRNFTEMERKITKLTDELDQTLTKLHETKTELDETKTRLSKAMGNMLTDNNPNIADLSDKNRPTKLSERYAELYDNQWTDAFDILVEHFHIEESAIAALLQILKDTMTFCRNKAYEQMDNLRCVLALSNDKEDGGISTDLGKLLKDCRKAMASVAVGSLHKMYMSHISQSTDETIRTALKVSSFTKECLEVCWFMAIQDPPVVFAPELRQGSKFNTDLFKPYTSSGTHVEYVVWPALLLHEGGPVLAKGVAQGKGKKATTL